MSKSLPEIQSFARIKVIGVGGSGKGAINHMISSNLKGIDFIAMNTDTQDLHNCLASKKIHLGKNLTKGLGAGMDPEIGKRSAEETKEEIQDAVKGADIVFIACGMGGGTATGAAPIIAKAARDEGILTVAIVTKPFFFEGQKRSALAEAGLIELEKEVDALIAIPNDRLLSIIDKNMSVKEAFKMVDEVLKQAVDGIADIIKTSGTINLDFADIKRVLKDSGTALIGIGAASGENRAVEAAKAAISSPLLDVSITGAKGLLYAIYGNEGLSMYEVSEAAKIITESVDKDATIIFGIVNNDSLKKDELKIVVIATKFPTNYKVPPRRNYIPEYKNIEEDEKPLNSEDLDLDDEDFEEEVEIEKEDLKKRRRSEKKKEVKFLDTKEDKEETNTLKDTFSSIIKTRKPDISISEAEEKIKRSEINNELDEEKLFEMKKNKTKNSKKSIFLEDIEDDDDDWEILPPFLRKKK